MSQNIVRAGFRLVEERNIPEIDTRARLWIHEKSGAELLSLRNDDENKVFGVTFRTPPKDSTGVAHILEHSVLCGSEKYPLKEPFVELLKGSLKTFLNAFTYPDKTCYPVASANLQDFYNLIDVYMDAVFHPLIPEHVFRQEGWRLEPAAPGQDAPHGLIFKGVVFNEMKGAYSSPDGVLQEKAQQTLYPDTVYGLDSGGDPLVIPDLTYEAFKEFHRICYHPSNARFFFHGDDPEDSRLELVDSWIAPMGRLEPDTGVPLQGRFDAPREFSLGYPADPAEDEGDDDQRNRCMAVLSWLFPEPPDVHQALAYDMLETMLVGLPGAPLRKALLDSGLGEDLAGVGLESELLQSYFSAGLKGIAPESVDAVQECILQTLQELRDTGLPAELVEAAVNSTEFELRENNTGRFPRGLHLMLRSLTQWLYGKNPMDALAFEAPLEALKARLAAGERVFEELIDRLFLENPHRVRLLLQPDEGLAQQLREQEQQRIAAMAADLDEAGRKELARKAEELLALQQAPDDPEALARLPRLTLADLPQRNTAIPCVQGEIGGATTLLHDLPTSGLLYLDLSFDMGPVLRSRPALTPLAPLFARALLEMGTRKRDYVAMSMRIARKTGGVDAEPFATSRHCSAQALSGMLLRGKSTLVKAGELAEIVQELLCEADFSDAARLGQLVQEELAGLEQRLAPMGHRMALSRVAARFSESGMLNEAFHGVNQLFFLRRLATVMRTNPGAVLQALDDFRTLALHRQGLVCNVTAPSASLQGVQEALDGLVVSLPTAPGDAAATGDFEDLMGPDYSRPDAGAYALDAAREGLQLTSQVNYVAKAANIYSLGYSFHGAILAGIRLLSTGWLWDRVRVQGGAYGAFCHLDRLSGALSMASYRDPNITRTLQAFDEAAQALERMARDREALESAIIGTVGDIDEHMLPDAKGLTSLFRWLAGDGEEVRQTMRDQLLAADGKDLTAFVQALRDFAARGAVCALGPAQALKEAADEQWRLARLF